MAAPKNSSITVTPGNLIADVDSNVTVSFFGSPTNSSITVTPGNLIADVDSDVEVSFFGSLTNDVTVTPGDLIADVDSDVTVDFYSPTNNVTVTPGDLIADVDSDVTVFHTLKITGTHVHRVNWSALTYSVLNWTRAITAHDTPLAGDCPTLNTYYAGTYDVSITPDYFPPNDDTLRTANSDIGWNNGRTINDGCDFLAKGNYIHPTITVESVDGTSIPGGLLYYAGGAHNFDTQGVPGAIKRDFLEILSTSSVESLTTTTGGETVAVVLVFA